MNVSFVKTMFGVTIVALSLTEDATAAPPAVHSVPLPGRNFPTEKELAKFLEPLPVPAIPDDPPPHEGAMIDVPLTVEPPDLIVVEVLESLPGRPITGERLVRPDGTVSLGFYGDIYVRGLTPEQIKVKILLHLRTFLPDEVLGLYKYLESQGPTEPSSPRAMPEDPEGPAPPAGDNAGPGPKAQSSSTRPVPGSSTRRRAHPVSQRVGTDRHKPLTAPADEKAQNPSALAPADGRSKHGAPPVAPLAAPPMGMGLVTSVHPADSDRVFVDITSYNHQTYFVYGDVASPGRMPITGNETVLDAITHAGGLAATAESKNIRLVRPSAAGRHARTYRVDLAAIFDGDAKANYQILPGDRLIIGRNDVVQKTIELDRLASSFSNVINSMYSYNLMIGSLKQLGDPSKSTPAISADQREAALKVWVDFWARAMSQPGGVTLDEKTFREALLKALDTAPSPSPEKKD